MSPGQKTGWASLSILQGISPTQGSNTGPRHCRQTLSQLSYQGIHSTSEFRIDSAQVNVAMRQMAHLLDLVLAKPNGVLRVDPNLAPLDQ